jgi:hypothetical protein
MQFMTIMLSPVMGVTRDFCGCILYLADDFFAKNEEFLMEPFRNRFHQVLLSVVVLSEGHGREAPVKILLVLASSGNVKDSDSVGCPLSSLCQSYLFQ